MQETVTVTWRYCDQYPVTPSMWGSRIQTWGTETWMQENRLLGPGQVHAGRQETRTTVWGIRKGTQPDQGTGAGAWRNGDGDSGGLDQHLENQDTGH